MSASGFFSAETSGWLWLSWRDGVGAAAVGKASLSLEIHQQQTMRRIDSKQHLCSPSVLPIRADTVKYLNVLAKREQIQLTAV